MIFKILWKISQDAILHIEENYFIKSENGVNIELVVYKRIYLYLSILNILYTFIKGPPEAVKITRSIGLNSPAKH